MAKANALAQESKETKILQLLQTQSRNSEYSNFKGRLEDLRKKLEVAEIVGNKLLKDTVMLRSISSQGVANSKALKEKINSNVEFTAVEEEMSRNALASLRLRLKQIEERARTLKGSEFRAAYAAEEQMEQEFKPILESLSLAIGNDAKLLKSCDVLMKKAGQLHTLILGGK